MRTLNEMEMSAVGGGMQPLTGPDPDPLAGDPELDKWRIRLQLFEPSFGDNP
ncbi:MAG: hypothetical protein OXI73_07630 [Rhodospirillales bacterium]|nr:hypothetical protein [Rhodospirillales bacterium]